MYQKNGCKNDEIKTADGCKQIPMFSMIPEAETKPTVAASTEQFIHFRVDNGQWKTVKGGFQSEQQARDFFELTVRPTLRGHRVEFMIKPGGQ